MAKKRTSKSKRKVPTAIQFRAGATLEKILDEVTEKWDLESKHDAARRLSCLAAYDFGQRNHALIEEYSQRRYGRPDFTEAAHEIFVHIKGIDKERRRSEKTPMDSEERDHEIEQFVKNYVLLHFSPEEPVQEQHVKEVRR
jgi:hypothetical protein